MAEADDMVLVDCRCGRHSTPEEPKPQPEKSIRPKPGKKPPNLTGHPLDYYLPKEPSPPCTCQHSKNGIEFFSPPPPAPFAGGKMYPPVPGRGPGVPDQFLASNNWTSPVPIPPPIKPSTFPVYTPPPPMPAPAPIPAPAPMPANPAMAPDVITVAPLPRRLNKPDRRRRSNSIESYDSSSDESGIFGRRGGRSGKRGDKLVPFVDVSNHLDLMENLMPSGNARSRSRRYCLDLKSYSALLHPFNRRAYVNSIAFSAVDLKKYFWLIKLAEPETWYQWPSKQTLDQLMALSEAGLSSTIYEHNDTDYPKALSVPRICLGRSLLEAAESDYNGNSDDDVSDDDSYYAHRRARRPSPTKFGMRFYSVQQSEEVLPIKERLQDPRDVENHTLPIYRVVVTGSSDAAVAQAFYDAGANGWSTLFTCAVIESVGEKLAETKGLNAFERVDRLWKLAGGDTDKNKIYY
ncbi:MAG: hypothetical protein M1822_004890 [Bathelium mastoideum]|nr:MAG: hypothetical protein M1822_004890 [Bathelium mastoideum]